MEEKLDLFILSVKFEEEGYITPSISISEELASYLTEEVVASLVNEKLRDALCKFVYETTVAIQEKIKQGNLN